MARRRRLMSSMTKLSIVTRGRIVKRAISEYAAHGPAIDRGYEHTAPLAALLSSRSCTPARATMDDRSPTAA